MNNRQTIVSLFGTVLIALCVGYGCKINLRDCQISNAPTITWVVIDEETGVALQPLDNGFPTTYTVSFDKEYKVFLLASENKCGVKFISMQIKEAQGRCGSTVLSIPLDPNVSKVRGKEFKPSSKDEVNTAEMMEVKVDPPVISNGVCKEELVVKLIIEGKAVGFSSFDAVSHLVLQYTK